MRRKKNENLVVRQVSGLFNCKTKASDYKQTTHRNQNTSDANISSCPVGYRFCIQMQISVCRDCLRPNLTLTLSDQEEEEEAESHYCHCTCETKLVLNI